MIGLILIDLKRSWWRAKAILVANVLFSCLLSLMAHVFFHFIQQAMSYSTLDSGLLYNYTIIMNIFGFLSFSMVALVLLAIASNAILASFYIEKRLTDIATMKAHGMPETPVANMFFSQGAILFALGFAAGFLPVMIGGVIAFQGAIPITEQNSLLFMVHVVGNILVLFFVTKKKMNRTYIMTVSETMLDQWTRDPVSIRKMTGWKKMLRKLGPTVLYSYKSLVTRRHDAKKALAIFSCSLLLCGTLLTGSTVIAGTYEELVQASVGGEAGQGTVVIGHREVVERIENAYSAFHDEDAGMLATDWNATEFLLDNDLLNLSSFGDDIVNVDWRYTFVATAREIKGIVQDLESGGFIERGKNRSMDTMIFGVHFPSMFNAWDVATGPSQVLLGDTTAGLLFDDPSVQKLGIGLFEYSISGIVFDTAFNGRSVYIDVSQVSSILGITNPGYNCVFITLGGTSGDERQVIVDQLRERAIDAFGNDTVLLEMNDICTRLAGSIVAVAGLHLALATIAFLFVALFTLEFTSIIVSWNKKDHDIMPALGITGSRVRAMIMHQVHFILLPSAIVAFSLSLIVTSAFLIGNAVLPPIAVPVLIFLAMVGTLSFIQYAYLKVFSINREKQR